MLHKNTGIFYVFGCAKGRMSGGAGTERGVLWIGGGVGGWDAGKERSPRAESFVRRAQP